MPHPHSCRRLLAQGRPLVMGVLNVTPDSFSDGGRFLDPAKALAQAERMIAEGADIIDVGAESTRPYGGAAPVSAEDELARLEPIFGKVVAWACRYRSTPSSRKSRPGRSTGAPA